MLKRTSRRLRKVNSLLRFESLESRELLTAFDVLVFTKTEGFRHDSIGTGLATIEQLAVENDFSVTATEDANDFNSATLAEYEAVVFLNTTGDVLNSAQQSAFESYIRGGGGFMGVHSAADTEYDWAWYGDLVGGYFENHPQFQSATIVVNDSTHPSTSHLPERWTRNEEWYNYRANPRGDVHVLLTVDESTYSGGTMGYDHPIAWTHDFDGGRSFYTGLGHGRGAYAEPRIKQHLLGGILYAANEVPADAGATIDSNFEVTVLDANVADPMELEVADDGRVLIIERAGTVKVYRPDSNDTVVAGQLDVYFGNGQEDGLLGIALDPNFAENNWVYLYYSPTGDVAKQHLSRFVMNGDQLDMSSEQVLLEVPTQRTTCCHSGGSIAFGPDGSLYIATGDDTNPFRSDGFAPLNESPQAFFRTEDAQRTAANADDLRGKVLRIKPEADGSYSIPEGNLFLADGSAGRPEIFVMGVRNPFRISVDPATGWLYFGDVGPDAEADDDQRGPAGKDEINQVRSAGNFGWPYFLGNNEPYREYDFQTMTAGDFYDPSAPINNSHNNTGPMELPPANPAFIWYEYGPSEEFPELDALGGRTSMAGPVFRHDAASTSTSQFPSYYDNTLFIYDWQRNWIKEVKLDSAGDILKINPFLPSVDFDRPMDMEFGSDGAMYVLEWGSTFRGGNDDAQLVRIEYTNNNQPNPETPGDFDGDGLLTVEDIDLMCVAIRESQANSRLDLNADGEVNVGDLTTLVEDFIGTSFGDANLDGEFNSSDLVRVFQPGLYEDGVPQNASWATGDWNCDGDFDTSDMVTAFQAGGYVSAAVTSATGQRLIAAATATRPAALASALQAADPGQPSSATQADFVRSIESVRPASALRKAEQLDSRTTDSVFQTWAEPGQKTNAVVEALMDDSAELATEL